MSGRETPTFFIAPPVPAITAGLYRSRYVFSMTVSSALSVAVGGLVTHANAFAKSADRVVQRPAQPVENQTSLTAEVVAMKQAEVGYTANAMMIRTIDEMTDTLLDIRV